jgi:predicted permease
MGFPVLESLFGKKCNFYATYNYTAINILAYSLGLYLLMKGSGEKTRLNGKVYKYGMLAAIIVIIIYFTGATLPKIIISAYSFVGDITMPLAMMFNWF